MPADEREASMPAADAATIVSKAVEAVEVHSPPQLDAVADFEMLRDDAHAWARRTGFADESDIVVVSAHLQAEVPGIKDVAKLRLLIAATSYQSLSLGRRLRALQLSALGVVVATATAGWLAAGLSGNRELITYIATALGALFAAHLASGINRLGRERSALDGARGALVAAHGSRSREG